MEKNVFDSLIKGIRKGVYPESIYFFWNDEPMIHPMFEEYFLEIYSLLDNGFTKEIIISTNGLFLNKYADLLGNLNNPGLKIILSIDACNEEIYSKIRGEKFDMLIMNIEELLKVRGENQYPQIIYQMILLPENHNKISEFRIYFTELNKKYNGLEPYFTFNRDDFKNDVIYIKCPYPWGETEVYEDIKAKYINYAMDYGFPIAVKQAEIVATPRCDKICRNMFKGAVIHPDGNVSPCCVDFDASVSFGILPIEDLYDILTGDKINEFQEAMINNNLKKLPERCLECYLPEGRVIEKKL